jgi:hypothetical protein
VKFEVFMVVRMVMLFFWVLAPCRLLVDANVSEKHTVSIFRAEVAMLGSGWIYIDEDKGEGVGHSSFLVPD